MGVFPIQTREDGGVTAGCGAGYGTPGRDANHVLQHYGKSHVVAGPNILMGDRERGGMQPRAH